MADIFIHLLYFVHPDLDLAVLFVRMRERSIVLPEKKIELTIKLYELKMSAQSSFISILSDYLTLGRHFYSKKKKRKNRIILKNKTAFFSSNTLPNLLYCTENNAGNCKNCTSQSWIYMEEMEK